MKTINKILAIGLAAVLLFGLMMIPTTVDISKRQVEKYDEPYTVQEKNIVKVPYVVKYQEPVYKTVEHNEPVYKTVYDMNLWGNSGTFQVKNVFDIEEHFTGEYSNHYHMRSVVVRYYDGLDECTEYYYDIYCIETDDEEKRILGYNIWSEEVIDKYSTKEKTEYKEKIEYRDVVKTRTLEKETIITKEVNCLMYEKIFNLV